MPAIMSARDLPSSHDYLVTRARQWLKSVGCGVIFDDRIRCATTTGEQPDAIGWRAGVSILVECKTSRQDFLADQKKPFRKDPVTGMGDWRFYLCHEGIIAASDLPKGWGLLHIAGRRIVDIAGVPPNTEWITSRPWPANKDAEMDLMYSALRRLSACGAIDDMLNEGERS